MEQPVSSLLGKMILLKTPFEDEQEEYILTKEEEMSVIDHEVGRLEQYYSWKLKDVGIHSNAEILVRLAELDLTDKINVVDVLERANSVKHHRNWQKKQREKEEAEAEEKQSQIRKTWNANMIYRQIKWAAKEHEGKDLIADKSTMQIIKPLCYFLSEDERFESELGFSFKKGIIFRGISGLGKTFVVKCAAENERHPICILSMIEIADEVKREGEFNLPSGYSKYYLDDVGSEEHIQNHYGTRINWFKNFIETFYLRSNQYHRLILSTNNTSKDVEDKYGFRVRSRMKDMFNVIDVVGKDLRG